MHPVLIGFGASLAAGLATALGAIFVFLPVRLTDRVQAIALGLGGGVMLAATSFSLIVPGRDAAVEGGATPMEAAAIVALGTILGAMFLYFSHRYLPHEHFEKGHEGARAVSLKRIWLFILAITLHNFPEGLAVGVNFGAENFSAGIPLAVGIGLQNIPEGLVVALSLVAENYARAYALQVSLITGLVEPIGGLVGAGVVSVAAPLLPWAMAFAAGAMLFVISEEIVPESHNRGREQEATLGVVGGFTLMMLLDIGLG